MNFIQTNKKSFLIYLVIAAVFFYAGYQVSKKTNEPKADAKED
jgi:hypothetical protein